jgi:hypothetical protein
MNLTYEEWVEKFKPEKNCIVTEDRGYDGLMFETFGPELEYVRQQPANRVWTVLDADGRCWIASGTHFVNRVGYFVAGVPYVGEELVEIVIHEDPDGPLEVEQVANALNTAIESNTSFTFVDNLGDGESIVIDGTINIAVLTEELNKILAD